MSFDEALAGTSRLFQIAPAQQHPKGRPLSPKCRMAWLRIGSDDRGRPLWATVPFVLHRVPPAGSRIKWVYLHRERCGLRWRWQLQITLENTNGFQHHNISTSGAVGIDLNWRRVANGLRVAVAVGDDGRTHELVIQDADLERWHRFTEMQSDRDTTFDAIRLRLAEWIVHHDCPEWLIQATANLAAWRSAIRLQAVAWQWNSQRFVSDEEIFTALWAWRGHDAKDYDIRCHQGDKTLAWRDDLYRNWVARLCRGEHGYKTAVIEDIDWAELQRRPLPEGENKPFMILYRRFAAVGKFKEIIAEKFAETVEKPWQFTTQRCCECLQIERFDPAPSVTHTCLHCGETWDQDYSAAKLLLGLHLGTVEPAEEVA